jgi:hypothetical protein
MGAYKVNRNTLQSGGGPPMFRNTGDCVEICKREFLTDVVGSTAFTLNSYFINPGLTSSFPFLSLLAANFEQYELCGLIYEFRSTSATAVSSTNTALGTLIMSTNYDTLDSTFASKQQMEAYEYTVSTVPSANVIHPIECDPRRNSLTNLYVRTGSVPTGSDQRFYDMGRFQIATVGMQAAATIGELWVSYHVRLLKPKLPTPLGANLLSAHYSTTPVSANSLAVPVSRTGSNLSITFTSTTISIPYVGRWLLSVIISAATSVTVVSSSTASTNVVAATGWAWAESNPNANVCYTGNTSGILIENSCWDVTAPNGLITILTNTIVGAATGDFTITQVSSGLD